MILQSGDSSDIKRKLVSVVPLFKFCLRYSITHCHRLYQIILYVKKDLYLNLLIHNITWHQYLSCICFYIVGSCLHFGVRSLVQVESRSFDGPACDCVHCHRHFKAFEQAKRNSKWNNKLI